jgi:hypothetical protein
LTPEADRAAGEHPPLGVGCYDFGSQVRNGRVHGSLYGEPGVFREDMDRILHRGWGFACLGVQRAPFSALAFRHGFILGWIEHTGHPDGDATEAQRSSEGLDPAFGHPFAALRTCSFPRGGKA